jgi:hypothetical protein
MAGIGVCVAQGQPGSLCSNPCCSSAAAVAAAFGWPYHSLGEKGNDLVVAVACSTFRLGNRATCATLA